VRRFSWTLVLLVVALAASADENPNVAKGFNAATTYDFTNVEAVNLFNGSITLTLPLGPTYTVGDRLSYSFGLSYTGNNWNIGENIWESPDPNDSNNLIQRTSYYFDVYNVFSEDGPDAGLGWQLMLGKLRGDRTYIAPDGATHHFETTLHWSDPSVPDTNTKVFYTGDSTYLRLRQLYSSPTTYIGAEIDFPDGSIHKFDNKGRLVEMRDGLPVAGGDYPNWVRFARTENSTAKWLTVTDSLGRSHTLTFRKMTAVDVPDDDDEPYSSPEGELGNTEDPDHYFVLVSVDSDGFAGLIDTYSLYALTYVDDDDDPSTFAASPISRKYARSMPDCQVPKVAHVPLLAGITPPDGLPYAFTYDRGDMVAFSDPELEPGDNVTTACNRTRSYSGNVTSLTLPTGGSIEWDYGPWRFPNDPPVDGCHKGEGPCSRASDASVGVVTRRSRAAGSPNDVVTKRTYSQLSLSESALKYHTQITTVQDYVGFNGAGEGGTVASTVKNYYSIGTEFSKFATGTIPSEYALPFTRFADRDPDLERVDNRDDSKVPADRQRFLSTKTFDAGNVLTQTTYVAYGAGDGPDISANRRLRDESVVYREGNSSVLTLRDGFNGLGAYSTTTRTSTVAGTPQRVTYKHLTQNVTGPYDPAGSPLPPWAPMAFDYTTVTEAGRTVKTEYAFDPATPQLLKRKRLIRDTATGAQGASDVIVTYLYDTKGFLTNESYYGGDPVAGQTGVGTGTLSEATLGTLDYSFNHTRSAVNTTTHTWTETSATAGATVLSRDVTIDQFTGLVKSSRDTAGFATEFFYDKMRRPLLVMPDGRAWTKYTFPTTSTSRVVTVAEYPSADTSATPLRSNSYTFDGLGRLVKETMALPAGVQSSRYTSYDKLGRRESVTEFGTAPQSSLPKTEFAYDVQGRIFTVTGPAPNSSTKFTYTGIAVKKRDIGIATGTDTETRAVTTEKYDGHGRLTSVAEGSGPTSTSNRIGAEVLTEYSYGPDDKLSSVTMKGAQGDPVQHRMFDYDGRGFLRWESQPESGMTSYEYDSRGLVTKKRHGAASTHLDLNYTYDSSGRLVQVDGRDPWAANPDTFRVMKLFVFSSSTTPGTYDGQVNYTSGKLTHAWRYNYGPDPLEPMWRVSDRYYYTDPVGRASHRVTEITRFLNGVGTVMQRVTLRTAFDDLDQQSVVEYPSCFNCGMPNIVDPLRHIAPTRDSGRVTELSDFVNSITYSPNGMRKVLVHKNAIADTQTNTGLSRPSSIKFELYNDCIRPSFSSQPSGASYSGTTVNLSVSMNGTSPFAYQWYSDAHGLIAGATASSYNVPALTAPDTFWVEVSNPCGFVTSQEAHVTVSSCKNPTTGDITPIRQPDGSWQLVPNPTYRESNGVPQYPKFEWRRTSDNLVVGTSRVLVTGVLTATTGYVLKIEDGCGFATSAEVVIAFAAAMPATLSATWNGATQITVTWPAVAGVSKYKVHRRSGPSWEVLAPEHTATSYVDTAIVSGKTYAYRISIGDGYSNTDVATTKVFTNPVEQQYVSAAPVADMLDAVNKVRAAMGWPIVTWSNILTSADPLPDPGAFVVERHITSCRSRINEALQALGVGVTDYSDPDLTGAAVKALHIREVQQRAD
jgi:hypothetical protein